MAEQLPDQQEIAMARDESSWRDFVARKFREGEDRMTRHELITAENTRLIQHNTSVTEHIQANTAEIVAAFGTMKSGMRVLDVIGKVAKPLSYVVIVAGASGALWMQIKHWLFD